MKLSIKTPSSGWIISILGNARSGDEIQLRRLMVTASKSTKKIIIDLSKCENINSQVLGVLVDMHNTYNKAGGQLVLVSIGRKIENLLKITGIKSIFNISSSLASLRIEQTDSD